MNQNQRTVCSYVGEQICCRDCPRLTVAEVCRVVDEKLELAERIKPMSDWSYTCKLEKIATLQELRKEGVRWLEGKKKFKGKHKKTGQWVYGYYVFCRGHHYILQDYNDNGYDERWETSEWLEVLPESVNLISELEVEK